MLEKDISAFRCELGHSRVYLSTWSWATRWRLLWRAEASSCLVQCQATGSGNAPRHSHLRPAAQQSTGLFLHQAGKQTCCMALSTTAWTLRFRAMTSHWLETQWPSSASSFFSSPLSNALVALNFASSVASLLGPFCSYRVCCSNFSYISLLFLLLPSFTPFKSVLHLAARS